ncbi:unnamed protein product [Protopolystoma xenopodis]|uniref:DDHD domain-containing protein n=1 Tax=Protopolystoma xenopodis TaxID=117903 RepID=A0A448WDN3_9PLAT|nr:unnamed protein product [Protopolystoma xenopodis]
MEDTNCEENQSLTEKQLDSALKQTLSRLTDSVTRADAESPTSGCIDAEVKHSFSSKLNQNQRIDYVLQEGPLESLSDYMFAMTSHSVYWNSEDFALFLLRVIFEPKQQGYSLPDIQKKISAQLCPSTQHHTRDSTRLVQPELEKHMSDLSLSRAGDCTISHDKCFVSSPYEINFAESSIQVAQTCLDLGSSSASAPSGSQTLLPDNHNTQSLPLNSFLRRPDFPQENIQPSNSKNCSPHSAGSSVTAPLSTTLLLSQSQEESSVFTPPPSSFKSCPSGSLGVTGSILTTLSPAFSSASTPSTNPSWMRSPAIPPPVACTSLANQQLLANSVIQPFDSNCVLSPSCHLATPHSPPSSHPPLSSSSVHSLGSLTQAPSHLLEASGSSNVLSAPSSFMPPFNHPPSFIAASGTPDSLLRSGHEVTGKPCLPAESCLQGVPPYQSELQSRNPFPGDQFQKHSYAADCCKGLM